MKKPEKINEKHLRDLEKCFGLNKYERYMLGTQIFVCSSTKKNLIDRVFKLCSLEKEKSHFKKAFESLLEKKFIYKITKSSLEKLKEELNDKSIPSLVDKKEQKIIFDNLTLGQFDMTQEGYQSKVRFNMYSSKSAPDDYGGYLKKGNRYILIAIDNSLFPELMAKILFNLKTKKCYEFISEVPQKIERWRPNRFCILPFGFSQGVQIKLKGKD